MTAVHGTAPGWTPEADADRQVGTFGERSNTKSTAHVVDLARVREHVAYAAMNVETILQEGTYTTDYPANQALDELTTVLYLLDGKAA